MKRFLTYGLALLLACSWTITQAATAGGGQGGGKPGTRDPGVNKRQKNQKDRIRQGVRSGEITKEEIQELKSGQKAVRQEEKAMKSDGILTRDERKELHQDLNEQSKDIYEAKHDTDQRPKADVKDKVKAKKRERAKERLQNNPGKGEGQEKALEKMEQKTIGTPSSK